MSDRPYVSAALGLAAAAALGFGAARLTQAPVPAAAAPEAAPDAPGDTLTIAPGAIAASQIAVVPAAAGDLDAAVPASATVEAAPDAQAVLTAHAPGTVSRIVARIGDTVRAGQTLALVESRDASQIAADRAAATARVTLAARQLTRERTLLAQGVSPRADMEAAQAALAVAQADARRAAAAASAAQIAGDGRSVAIVSPIAGRVTGGTARLGQFVAAETELFRVTDPRRLQIVAAVPAADATHVRAGDRVTLTTGDGATIMGRVQAATGTIDAPSRAATFVVVPTGSAGMLLPGQLVQARILASGRRVGKGIVVPQAAVQTLGTRTIVFVRTATGFRARPVRVAGRSGGLVAIGDGLRAGAPIATTNAFLLKAELEKNDGGEE